MMQRPIQSRAQRGKSIRNVVKARVKYVMANGPFIVILATNAGSETASYLIMSRQIVQRMHGPQTEQ